MIGDEESDDGRLQVEAEEEREHQDVDFRKLEAGRRRRGAWGKRKHAATVEATAYRIVWQCEHRNAYLLIKIKQRFLVLSSMWAIFQHLGHHVILWSKTVGVS